MWWWCGGASERRSCHFLVNLDWMWYLQCCLYWRNCKDEDCWTEYTNIHVITAEKLGSFNYWPIIERKAFTTFLKCIFYNIIIIYWVQYRSITIWLYWETDLYFHNNIKLLFIRILYFEVNYSTVWYIFTSGPTR